MKVHTKIEVVITTADKKTIMVAKDGDKYSLVIELPGGLAGHTIAVSLNEDEMLALRDACREVRPSMM